MASLPGTSLKPAVQLPRDPAACWDYLGARTQAGYGKKTVAGRNELAHRWIWLMLFGPIPDSPVVSHTCSNPGCINPYHLRLCSQTQANRAGIGATLTARDVREIRRVKHQRGAAVAQHLATR